MNFISKELEHLKKTGFYRKPVVVGSAQEAHVEIKGRDYICFCSNNYLGLANDRRLQKAAMKAIAEWGCGTGASRLISGTMEIHAHLEKEIARFKQMENSIIFPTGYMANVGIITALVGSGDVVISDRFNHASIIDGCRLSGAHLLVYPHADIKKLAKILERCHSYRRRLIITDSIFSMDGDMAPLPEITTLCSRSDALLMVDEAHATGVWGEKGRGIAEHLGVENKVDVSMGTLSKALGSMGGFAAGSNELINYLRNKSRSYIYTTAHFPAACAAALAAIKIVEQDKQPREKLHAHANWLREEFKKMGYDTLKSTTQIIPLVLGETEKAMRLSELLWKRGIMIPAIRPPTVPRGTSRLRITVMATHTAEDIEALLASLRALRSSTD